MRFIPFLASCAFLYGQGTGRPAFELASVKASDPIRPGDRVYFGPPHGGPGTSKPDQITWSYATMKNLLMNAYDVTPFQVSGPPWLGTERYEIQVRVPNGATKEQVKLMWQNLLAERFHVVLHHEPKEFQVEELVVAPGGSKLKDTAEDLTVEVPPGPPNVKDGNLLGPGMLSLIFPGPSPKAHSVARAQPLSKLLEILSNQLNRPVLDRTGLTGRYDFTLDYSLRTSAPDPGADAGEPDPDVTTALQQQLGLKLIASKAKLDVLVIDKVEKMPTAN